MNNNTLQLTVPASAGTRRHFQAGETIFHQGDPGSTLLYVLTGTVRIVKDGVQIAVGGRGEFFGEMSLLESSPRFAAVAAETECEAIEYNLEEFSELVRSEPGFAIAVMRNLSHKLRDSDSSRLSELEENNGRLSGKNTELVELNEFLEQLIDRSPAGIAVIDHDGMVELLNPAGRRMFALARYGLRSSLLKYFVDKNPVQELQAKKQSTLSGQFALNLGSVVKTVFLSASILNSTAGHERYLINFVDITELTELNDQVIRLNRFAGEAEMASEVAHSINNYLAVISGNLELLDHRFGSDGHEDYRRYIATMRSSVDAIISYVESLMTARNDTGVFQRRDLIDTVRGIVRVLQPQKRFRNVNMAIDVAIDFPKLVNVCESQIQQVLLNLLTNAADALNTQNENTSPRIDVTLRRDPHAANILISISDNGPGVAPERLAELFHRRFTTKEKGHGIGLLTVNRIINAHGGTIEVSSTVGQGTTFLITIPA